MCHSLNGFRYLVCQSTTVEKKRFLMFLKYEYDANASLNEFLGGISSINISLIEIFLTFPE